MSQIKPTMRGGVPRCSRTECPKFELHNAFLRSGTCLVNEVGFGPDDGDVCEPAVVADREMLLRVFAAMKRYADDHTDMPSSNVRWWAERLLYHLNTASPESEPESLP